MAAEMSLRCRDYLWLPLVALGTMSAILLGGELASRALWYQRGSETCAVQRTNKAPSFKPHCIQTQKWFETGTIEEQFNDCGYRTAESCGPKLSRQVRGVVLGTSIAMGYMVEYEASFAALVTDNIRRACDIPFDLQNLSMVDTDRLMPQLSDRLGDVDKLDPDFAVFTVSTYDFTHKLDPVTPTSSDEVSISFNRVKKWIDNYVRYRSHLFAILRRLAFINSDFYMKSKLSNKDDYGFMDEPLAPIWSDRFSALDRLVGLVAGKARSLHIPLFVMFIPTDPEIRLGADQTLVKNPQILEQAFAELAKKYDVILVPAAAALRLHSTVPDLYFPIDGHPAAAAHAIIADVLTDEILRTKTIPALESCRFSPRVSLSGSLK
jgi:hypothetical protein